MPKIILAHTDDVLLESLEPQFFRQFGDDLEITVISSAQYMKKYFSVPREADALVVAERLYTEELEKHGIANFFFLTENKQDGATGRLDENRLYEYSSVQEIVNVVAGVLAQRDGSRAQTGNQAKIVLVYSPIGGAGATSVAMGLCATLFKNYKKCLYINTQSLQTFGAFFTDCVVLDDALMGIFTTPRNDAARELKAVIRTELTDFLPPFGSPLASSPVPITAEHFIRTFDALKAEQEYEYVVVDCGSEFSPDVSRLMGYADRDVIVFAPGEAEMKKLDCLLRNIIADNRVTLVCNKCRSGWDPSALPAGVACEEIAYSPAFPQNIQELGRIAAFQKIANSIM